MPCPRCVQPCLKRVRPCPKFKNIKKNIGHFPCVSMSDTCPGLDTGGWGKCSCFLGLHHIKNIFNVNMHTSVYIIEKISSMLVHLWNSFVLLSFVFFRIAVTVLIVYSKIDRLCGMIDLFCGMIYFLSKDLTTSGLPKIKYKRWDNLLELRPSSS